MNTSSGSSTTVVNKLPDYIHPDKSECEVDAIQSYLQWAQKIYNDKDENFLPYDKETFHKQEQDEIDGIEGLAARGRNGDDLIENKAKPYLENVLAGNYLLGNASDFRTARDNTINKPKSTFISEILPEIGCNPYIAGFATGENLAKELAEEQKYYDRMEKRLYAINYKSERRRREQALPYGVEYGKQDVVNREVLRMAGLYQREYNQGKLEDDYKMWYDEMTTKARVLEVLGNAIRSLVGTHSAITTPYYRPSPVVATMGGAMSGAMAGFTFGGPTGAAIGGGIGAVLGFLSTN